MDALKMSESRFITSLPRTQVNGKFPCTLTIVFVLVSVASLHIQGISAECPAGSTACSDGVGCYKEQDKCDHINDCLDRTDERECGLTCDGEFACSADDLCIPLSYKCDGSSDCSDGADEEQCDSVSCIEGMEFQCVSDRKCIQSLLKCDGNQHCHDGSDEEGCDNVPSETQESGCDADAEFDCLGDGTECIHLDDQCNQNADCSNGRDENATICDQFVTVASVVTVTSVVAKTTTLEIIEEANIEPDVNECEDQAPCAHDCENTDGSFVCTCTEGYQLAADKISCIVQGVEPELIVANGSRLLSYGLHSNVRHTTSLGAQMHGIGYDVSRGGKIFYINAERKVISWIHKDHTGQPESLVETVIVNPVSVAYDWIHDALYWADSGNGGPIRHARIEVVSLRNMYRTTLLVSPQVHDPRYLVVDPRAKQGYLYWAEVGTTPDICRSGLDGSDVNCFASPNIEQPSGLCLDFLTDTLFWMDRRENTLVSYSLKEGVRTVLTTINEYPRHSTGLDVLEDWVYWADDRTKSVYKWNAHTMRESDKPIEVLNGLVFAKDVVVYHPYKQQPEDSSYCGTNNGGCSHICLPSPAFKKYRCACPNVDKLNQSYVLDDDNKLCLTRGGSGELIRPSSSSHLEGSVHVTRGASSYPETPVLYTTSSPRLQKPTNSLVKSDDAGKSDASSAHTSKWVGIGVGAGVGALVLLVAAGV